MHITLESDYAIRIVAALAEAEGRLDAKTISERAAVTLRFSLKILGKLAAGGIVKSYKGSRGGYELARSPAEITLGDVIETVEGRYCFSRCLSDGYSCSKGNPAECRYRHVFDEISQAVKKRLDEYTFEMLTGD